MTWRENAAGREVPSHHRDRELTPYSGPLGIEPSGTKAGARIPSSRHYPTDGDKRVGSLKEALVNAGLRDGMTLSTHHHFRNGDKVATALFRAASELGIKDLRWFPSAVFPCHAELIPYLESGVIRSIEGSLNGALGELASAGKLAEWAVLRSHGNRYRSLQDGDVRVDIAVIAAPSSDMFGNMTGAVGPSACGGLGFAVGDAEYADHVIAITDNLVPFPLTPWQISGGLVDQVVVCEEIGDPSQIVSGTTVLTRSPERVRIAELAAQFVAATGVMRDGWSFQAGAGGISLSFTVFLGEMMRERGIAASFARGGSTRYLVEMLESGLVGTILDGQTFDLDGVRSLATNPRHVMTNPFTSYNYHSKGRFASMLDCAVLGATEVDLNFNANVVSHSDGKLLHGIGGWQDALFSRVTILAVPTMRNRVPIVRERLTTFCGPGELIDVIVTERGIAINPLREDLIAAAHGKNLPLTTLDKIKAETEARAGGPPQTPRTTDDVIGLITWVDGTALDVVRCVLPLEPIRS